ncbi:hypothetical protein Slin15195_G017650 [Septoria linicola]|uniref:Uncharacterized protein n=1 Tax=Septoria linicola TaxID=215465 RepID=A0A9Q9APG8_9PEZI|nr:hypothetical protein Slin15195_G017650 [Septoria linicola]
MGCGPSKSRIDNLIDEAVKTDYENRRGQDAFGSEDRESSDIDQLSGKRKSSMTVTIRSTNPTLHTSTSSKGHCTNEALPAADDQVTKRGKAIGTTGTIGWGIWKTSKERQDFITNTLIVLSGNGFRNISRSRILLQFPRVGTDHIAYRAGFAIMYDPDGGYHSEAMIAHAFVARKYAVDKKAAFMELMFDVEAMLESHLHSGEVHISRYGISEGQKELEWQVRNGAIKKIEAPPILNAAAQAMNGLNEPHNCNRPIAALPQDKLKRNSDYGGFVVGEIKSRKSTPSLHTNGGVGAMPYNNWMQPMPSRARQMHSHVPAIPTLSSMTSFHTSRSQQNYISAAVDPAGARRTTGAHLQRRHSEAFLSVPRPDCVPTPPTLSSASTTSDQTPSSSSNPQSNSTHSSIQAVQPVLFTSTPDTHGLSEKALTELTNMTSDPHAKADSHQMPDIRIVTKLPPVKPQRRNTIAGPISFPGRTNSLRGKPTRYRSTRGTPNVNLQYYGLDDLEEDSDENKLFS